MLDDPVTLIAILGILLLSLSVHEAAHGWVALLCGDTTARDLGRITLNPIVHIDLFMSILLPVILYMAGGPVFGGAKPVPVVFHRLRNPWRDMTFVAMAGPASNILLAVLFAGLYFLAVKVFGMAPVRNWDSYQVLPMALFQGVLVNVYLAVFNLIPLPPLDGSRLMAWVLPESLRATYLGLERFGLLILFGLIYLGVFGYLVLPTSNVIINGILSLYGI